RRHTRFSRDWSSDVCSSDLLVAIAQVKMPTRPKLELARNYWDEMGRGSEAGMHGPMLDRLATALDLHPRIEETAWPSLALGNTRSEERRVGKESRARWRAEQ